MKYLKLFENWINEDDKELKLTGDYQSKKFITNFYEMIQYWKIPLPSSMSEDAFKVAVEFLNDLKSRGEAIESEIKAMSGISENKGKTISQILKDTPDDKKENTFKHYVNFYSNNISCYRFYAFMWKGSKPQAPIIINHLKNNFKDIKHNSKVPTSAYVSYLFNIPFYNTKRRMEKYINFNPDTESSEFRNMMLSGIGLFGTLMFFSNLATNSLDYYNTQKEMSRMIRESYNFLISMHQRGWYDITGDLKEIEDIKTKDGNTSTIEFPEDWLYNLFTSNNKQVNTKLRTDYFEDIRDYSINYYKTSNLDVVTKYLIDLKFLTHNDIYNFIKAGGSMITSLSSKTIQTNLITGEIMTDKISKNST
jgi:hypothetical protein